jgi:sigma-B regulation protein RsbU (phosphoserine phosphatase)
MTSRVRTGQTAIVLGDVAERLPRQRCLRRNKRIIVLPHNSNFPCRDADRAQRALQERRLDSQYVTMLFACGTMRTRLCRCNSGAVQPIFVERDSRDRRAEGFPLGMFPNATYEEFNGHQPGDAIVFVSDGILDAENEQGRCMRMGCQACFAVTATGPPSSCRCHHGDVTRSGRPGSVR